jgi:CelD/BcsL family acetyltransferase involved in cellulose biosynthesis
MSWQVTVDRSWQDAASRWRPLFDRPQFSPFQTERWLSRWYASFAGRADIEPLLIHVAAADGTPALALPWIIQTGGRLRTIAFADLGITDYSAPVLGPAAPASPAEAKALWGAVRAALPPADLLQLEKLPETILGMPNPLLASLRGQPSNLFGNLVRIDTDWDSWLHSFDKSFRKELARFWRVFTRDPSARFVVASTPDEALEIYRLLEIQQSERIHALNLPYQLDEPAYRDFYRALLLDGLQDGSVVLSALMAGDELVGSLFGLRQGEHYAMVRTSSALDGWGNCSPGRLVIERTMAALFEKGVRTFDFTIGDYSHKRAFHVAHVALVDVQHGLSWRGWPSMGYAGAKAYVKQRPGLERWIRKVSGRAG